MSSQDLIRDDDEHKTYSGGLLAIVVICLLLGLIGLVTYLTMPDSGNKEKLMPIYFSDIFKINSLMTQFEYSWKDGHLIFRNSSGHFYAIKTNSTEMTASVLLKKQHYVQGMSVSFDLSVWLIPTQHRKNEDLEDESTYASFTPTPDLPYSHSISIGGDPLSYLVAIAWAPRSKYAVAVFRRNVYYSANPLVPSSFICISCAMSQRSTYGQFIGYYKEKIFKTNKAFWWDRNGRFLAFLSTSDDHDKKANVEVFDHDSLSPKYHNISYAQAGSSPSLYRVEIHVVHLSSQKLYSLNVSQHSPFMPYHIVHVQWFNDTLILVSVLSADQTKVALLLCEVFDRNCFTILEKTSEGWVNAGEYQDLLFDNGGGHVFIAMTVTDGARSRRHLARIKVERRRKDMVTWFNLGRHDVIRLNYFDALTQCIYYLASAHNSSNNQLYRINIGTLEIRCESCNFTTCYRNEVVFVDSHATFLHRCLGPDPHSYRLVHATDGGYTSILLEENLELKNYLKNKSLSRIEYFPVNVGDDRRRLQITAKIFLPRSLNASYVIQYPVLVILSDSTQKETVNDDFSVGWIDYLTSYLNYVVIQMDVLGVREHKLFFQTSSPVRRRGGNLYLMMDVLKHIIKNRAYMDNSSVGIIGEGYGGYLAGNLMGEENKFPEVRCGVAVSPIVDFSFYDSFLAQRYIGSFKRHEAQYMNSVLQASSALNKKELLLIHNANQNDVLFEHSAKLIKDLVDKDIMFELVLLYQGISVGDDWRQNPYLLKKITKFVVNCFNRSSTRYSILEDDSLNS